MTESTITDLLKELIAIREGMANKTDVANLGDGLQALLNNDGALLASVARQERWMAEYRPQVKPEYGTTPGKEDDPAFTRIHERYDRLSNWYRGLETRLNELENATPIKFDSTNGTMILERVDTMYGKLLDRIENIEKAPRFDVLQLQKRIDQLEIDKADMLHMLRDQQRRLALVELNLDDSGSLRSAEPGETRTRPDTGASRTLDICCECGVPIVIPVLDAPGICANCWNRGGSGSQPAEPAPDSSGTERTTQELREKYGEI